MCAMNLESLIAVNSQEEIDMNLFLITFIPCGTQFLVDQEAEGELPTDDYVGCGFCEAVKRLDGRSLAHDPL